MKYELATLEELIRQLVAPHVPESITADRLDAWLSTAQQQQKSIKQNLVEDTLSIPQEEQLKRYIRHHQTALIDLLDQLSGYIDLAGVRFTRQEDAEITLAGVQIAVYLLLEDLLSFIEKYFPKYFNPDAILPVGFRLTASHEVREGLANLRIKFGNGPFESRLIDIALEPLVEFLDNNPVGQYSFRELRYLMLLIKELTAFEPVELQVDHTQQLAIVLARLNFNSFRFFDFCVKMFKRSVTTLHSAEEQLLRLAYLQKVVNQLQVKPGICLKSKHSSIQMQLQTWIAEEIYYLEKRNELISHQSVIGSAEEPKIRVELSVSQLAYFVRLLMEAGILTNQPLSEVLRFVSRHFETPHTAVISFESLRTKYYTVEQSTQDSVNERIIQMLNILRKK